MDAPFGEDRFADISPYDNSVGAKMIDTDSLASVDGGVTEALAGTTRAGTYLWCAHPSSPRPRHDRAKPTRTPLSPQGLGHKGNDHGPERAFRDQTP